VTQGRTIAITGDLPLRDDFGFGGGCGHDLFPANSGVWPRYGASCPHDSDPPALGKGRHTGLASQNRGSPAIRCFRLRQKRLKVGPRRPAFCPKAVRRLRISSKLHADHIVCHSFRPKYPQGVNGPQGPEGARAPPAR
jgi:hypothetical protein